MPWASTYCDAGRRRSRRSRRAARITASWDGPLGAVRPLLRPSWLTALPRITAQDPVAVGQRVAQPLQHDHAAALAPHKPSAAASNALQRPSAASIRALRERDVELGRQDQVDAAGQGQVALAGPQALAGQVDRHQRRRAGRVDRDGRSLEAKDIGRPVRMATLWLKPVA